jgi:hypothetical protein
VVAVAINDKIWYREELVALRALVEDQIMRVSDATKELALVHLHGKLGREIAAAPSARTAVGKG